MREVQLVSRRRRLRASSLLITQMQNPDDIGRCGIELIMQGREKEGRAMVLEATRMENEARREAYRRYWSQMADQKASRQAEGDPER